MSSDATYGTATLIATGPGTATFVVNAAGQLISAETGTPVMSVTADSAGVGQAYIEYNTATEESVLVDATDSLFRQGEELLQQAQDTDQSADV